MEVVEDMHDVGIISDSIMYTYKQNYSISKQYDRNETKKDRDFSL